MNEKSQVEQLAAFVQRSAYEQLTPEVVDRFRLHILDTLGCAIGALSSEPTRAVRRHIEKFGSAENGACTLIGGGRAAPDRAALLNGSLVRYLDFMDNFLAPKQTCHPCDTFASVFAAAELCGTSGRAFLTCLAVAYQVFTKLIEEAPVQELGFDHTVQLAYGVAAGAAKALHLNEQQTAHALALAGASAQGLVVTRSEYLSNWKGLQSADVATSALTCAFLAREGISGPLQVLDGKEGFPKAFKHTVHVDWEREPLDAILRCSIKAHNAEVHTQPVLEAVLALREENGLADRIDAIQRVEVEIFKQAYDITGSGEEAGNKYDVRTKEQADHSLPYLVSVALLDGEVTPKQFTQERIQRNDVQMLLKRVRTLRDDQFTQRYPKETPCRVNVELDGKHFMSAERCDWLGFYRRPMPRQEVRWKFDALTASHASVGLQDEIADAVFALPETSVRDLAAVLGRVSA
jgi:2-methylcitrate dehydratase